jgi:C4-dicarboxylate transporter DctM subunit
LVGVLHAGDRHRPAIAWQRKAAAQRTGMDPVHFCIFMLTSLVLGFIIRTMGLNLFVVSSLTGQPVLTIAKHAFPCVAVMVLIPALIGFVPGISLLFLPK